jgi:hypothetical protein
VIAVAVRRSRRVSLAVITPRARCRARRSRWALRTVAVRRPRAAPDDDDDDSAPDLRMDGMIAVNGPLLAPVPD